MTTHRDIACMIAIRLIAARRQLDAQEINAIQYHGQVRMIYHNAYAATAYVKPMSPDTFARVWRMACKMVDLTIDGNHIPYDSKEAT